MTFQCEFIRKKSKSIGMPEYRNCHQVTSDPALIYNEQLIIPVLTLYVWIDYNLRVSVLCLFTLYMYLNLNS